MMLLKALVRLLLNGKSDLGDGEDPLGIVDEYIILPFEMNIPLVGIAPIGTRLDLYWILMGFVPVHHEVVSCSWSCSVLFGDIDFQWLAAIRAF